MQAFLEFPLSLSDASFKSLGVAAKQCRKYADEILDIHTNFFWLSLRSCTFFPDSLSPFWLFASAAYVLQFSSSFFFSLCEFPDHRYRKSSRPLDRICTLRPRRKIVSPLPLFCFRKHCERFLSRIRSCAITLPFLCFLENSPAR